MSTDHESRLEALPIPPAFDHLRELAVGETPPGLGEAVWIEVIQKMDEVYNDLLQYEVALEEKNAALEEAQGFVMSVLASMSDILLVCDRDGLIQEVNRASVEFTGRSPAQLVGCSLFDLFADAASRDTSRQLFQGHGGQSLHDCELYLTAADASAVPVSLSRLRAASKHITTRRGASASTATANSRQVRASTTKPRPRPPVSTTPSLLKP